MLAKILTLLLFTGLLHIFPPCSSIYMNEETLDGEGKYVLRWDVVEDRIEFEVVAGTLGFVGFGISPSGRMTGADIFIAGVRPDGSTYGLVSTFVDSLTSYQKLGIVIKLHKCDYPTCMKNTKFKLKNKIF